MPLDLIDFILPLLPLVCDGSPGTPMSEFARESGVGKLEDWCPGDLFFLEKYLRDIIRTIDIWPPFLVPHPFHLVFTPRMKTYVPYISRLEPLLPQKMHS